MLLLISLLYNDIFKKKKEKEKKILPAGCTVPLPQRLYRLRVNSRALCSCYPCKLGHILVTPRLPSNSLSSQSHITVILFHEVSAKKVSCIRCYSTELFSTCGSHHAIAVNSEILNTSLRHMCTALMDHLWVVMGHFSSSMNNDDLEKTPLSPWGNGRFDSRNATPTHKSQQMISLAYTSDSALVRFMSDYMPNEARGQLRVDNSNGSTPNRI